MTESRKKESSLLFTIIIIIVVYTYKWVWFQFLLALYVLTHSSKKDTSTYSQDKANNRTTLMHISPSKTNCDSIYHLLFPGVNLEFNADCADLSIHQKLCTIKIAFSRWEKFLS